MLHEGRHWDKATIELTLDAPRTFGISFGHLHGTFLGEWVDGLHALTLLREQDWAQARLAAFLIEEIETIALGEDSLRAPELRSMALAQVLATAGRDLEIEEERLQGWVDDTSLCELVRRAAAIVLLERGLAPVDDLHQRLHHDPQRRPNLGGMRNRHFQAAHDLSLRFGLLHDDPAAIVALEDHDLGAARALGVAPIDMVRAHAPWVLCALRLNDVDLTSIVDRLATLDDAQRCQLVEQTTATNCPALERNLQRHPRIAAGCDSSEPDRGP